MSSRTKPPFRADHVGSLLRPEKLRSARAAKTRGDISAEQLRAAEDEAIREAIKLQEDAGLTSITDGEFRRNSWHIDFLERFGNVAVIPSKIKARFQSEQGPVEYTPPTIQVVGKLARPRPIFVDHFRFVRDAVRDKPHLVPKITIPSPSTMHFRGGRAAVDKTAYPDMAEFYADLSRVYNEEVRDFAAAGCRYLQIDEVYIAYLCDPALRQQAAGLGEDPDKLPQTYVEMINGAIRGRPADMAVCMHLCRGNNSSGWVASGGYEPVADVLFNEIRRRRLLPGIRQRARRWFRAAALRAQGQGRGAGSRHHQEGPRSRPRTSSSAASTRPRSSARSSSLALSPQCGFSSTIAGNKLTVEEEAAKLRLVVDVAKEVWG